MTVKKHLLLLLFWWVASSVWANEPLDKGYYLVKDYSEEWLVYDQDQKNYVPYVTEEHGNELSVNVLIDLESSRFYELLVYVEKDSYLFFNGSLQRRQMGGTWQRFKIDSLLKIYPNPQFLLTLYGSAGKADKKVLVGHRKLSAEKPITIEEASFLVLRPRERSPLSDFFTLSMLLLVTFAALLFNGYPRAFSRFYNLSDLLSLDPRDESFLVNKPFSRTNLLFVGFTSLLMAYLFLFVQSKQYELFTFKQFIDTQQGSSESWLDFGAVSVVILAVLLVKYLGLLILGSLYQLDSIIKRHYFKVIQSCLLFYTLAAVAMSVCSFYVLDWAVLIKYFLIIPSIVFYVFRAALLFFTIRNMVTVKNLYVISYLCIAEIIPLIIGIRYAL